MLAVLLILTGRTIFQHCPKECTLPMSALGIYIHPNLDLKRKTMDYPEHNIDSPNPLLWTLMVLISLFFYMSHRYDHTLFRQVTLPYLVILFIFLWFCLAYILAEKGACHTPDHLFHHSCWNRLYPLWRISTG